jgi:hypothetical protein
MEWRHNSLKNGPNGDSFGTLGQCYWGGMQTKHQRRHLKKAVRFNSKIDDWCRLENFADMDDGVYKKLVESVVLEVLEHDVWRDTHTSFAQTEAEAYGRKTRHSIFHLEKLVSLTR